MVKRFSLVAAAAAGLVFFGAISGASAAPDVYQVPLAADTTAENVVPQIVEAGRAELAAVCAQTPGAAVRVLNPLASGDYVDVPCSALLDGGEAVTTTGE